MTRNCLSVKSLVPQRERHACILHESCRHDGDCLGERFVGMSGSWGGVDQCNRFVDQFSAADDPIQGILKYTRNAMSIFGRADQHSVRLLECSPEI